MIHFKKIGYDNYWDKSILEKIDLLISNDVFFVRPENYDSFLNHLNSMVYPTSNIIDIPYLNCNQEIVEEIGDYIIEGLKTIKVPGTSYGVCELLNSYETQLVTSRNNVDKLETACFYLHEAGILLKDTWNENPIFHNNIQRNFTKNILYEEIKNYTERYSFNSPLPEEIKVLRADVIMHTTTESVKTPINNYLLGSFFNALHDVLLCIEYLKKEITSIHVKNKYTEDKIIHEVFYDNIKNNHNRYINVFKNAKACEFFIFIFLRKSVKTKIEYSYYYEIFFTNGLFKKGIKTGNYLSFINEFFGLKENEIRKNLPNSKYHNHLNDFIKYRKEFDSENPLK